MLRYLSKRQFSSPKIPSFPTQLFINGKFVNSQSGETISTLNPSTGKEICKVQRAGAADVDLAVKAAKDAFKNYGILPPQAREAMMHSLAGLVDQHAEELATLESLDNGKSLAKSKIDVLLISAIIKYYAGMGDKHTGDTYPMAGPFMAFSEEVPIGVCGQIIPWNFPIVMFALKIASVLGSGCTTVLKPAELTPLTALKMAELIQKSGIPDGVINVLPGFGHDCGQAILDHPDIKKIAFTGSSQTGKLVAKAAADSCKRVTLELGGKSPNIILDDCDIDAAVQNAIEGNFENSGQFCMAATRHYVHEGIYDEFVEKVTAAVQQVKVGDPFEEGVQNGPLISEAQANQVLGYIQKGIDEGAKLMCGGKKMDRDGNFVEMTVFADCTDDMTIVKDEIFGPVMSILKFKTIDEVIQRANNSKFGLAAGVSSSNLKNTLDITRQLNAGQVWVNKWYTLQPCTPFGGFNQSGIGRELGVDGLKAYKEKRVTIINQA